MFEPTRTPRRGWLVISRSLHFNAAGLIAVDMAYTFGGDTYDFGTVSRAASVRVHTRVMRESDFRDADALLIRPKYLARPDRQACLILDGMKLYLANQFDRGDRPYMLPAELAVAGTTTCRFSPREGDTHSSTLSCQQRTKHPRRLSWA
jgi:hypothetical protein